MSNLSAPHFHNEEASYALVEARVWPSGPICPHCCGYVRISKMGGNSNPIVTSSCGPRDLAARSTGTST